MRYLITGAAGFIGAHLSRQISALGHEVVGIDSLSNYYSRELKILRINEFLSPFNIKNMEVSVTDLIQLEKIFNNFMPETVIHLGAQAGVRLPLNESNIYIDNNITGFNNVLLCSMKFGVQKLLYASSSSVYGNNSKIPYIENENKLEPTSIYGATKLVNEIMAKALSGRSKLKLRGMRFFTVYGSFGRPDMSYFRLINSALNGSAFNLFGDGSIERDFTYIDDVVKGVVALIDQLDHESEGISDIVNLGGGKPSSMLELIKIIENITGNRINVQIEPPNELDVKSTCANFSLLKELTNFVPSVSLEKGIETVAEWSASKEIKYSLNRWVESTI